MAVQAEVKQALRQRGLLFFRKQALAEDMEFKMIDDKPPVLQPAVITHHFNGRTLRCVNALPGA